MNISDFIDTEFKTFSNLDNVRSIPKLIDGLKDSQRKAVYGMILHGPSEIKVTQAAGKFSLVTHYAHGETSMADTIVGLAQKFPGANNVNVFEPIGQFGSRLSPKPAAHRYIYTKPSKHFRTMFRKDDDHILTHRYEDGDKAEPLFYAPVLPLWAINGAVGIGTGHSVKILPRAPQAVSELVSKLAQGTNPQQRTLDKALKPHFEGWKGTVENGATDNQWIINGSFERINTTTLRITELPVTYDVNRYKKVLIDLLDKKIITDYDNNSSEDGFDFEVKVPRALGKAGDDKIMTTFKLSAKITENVTLWGMDGNLKKYDNFYEALKDFVYHRKALYLARKASMIDRENERWIEMCQRREFITTWHQLDTKTMKTDEIMEYMVDMGLKPEYVESFLKMGVASLSKDKIKELDDKIIESEKRMEDLKNTPSTSMWLDDLKSL